MKKTWIFVVLIVGVVMLFQACVSIPRGAVAVKPFDKARYLGKWYEIARMDFRFERNLNNVTATYSVNADGSIKVDNQGFNFVTQKWEQAIGKAKLLKDPREARLKVSFFGPFYSGYNVIALDPEYKYALVAGNNLKYLWLLARETTVPDAIREKYLALAREIGYDTLTLIWGEHKSE